MKRYIALALSAVLLCLAFAGCSSDQTGGNADNEPKSVCAIVSTLSEYSGGLYWQAVQQFCAEQGITPGYLEYGYDNGYTIHDCLRDAVKTYDIITLPASYEAAEMLQNGFAKEHGDKIFVLCIHRKDMVVNEPNVLNVLFKEEDYSYLAGVMAAKMSKSGVLGFVGGEEIGLVKNYLLSFIAGALSVDPDIKVQSAYIGNYSDTKKAENLTNELIGRGADIVFFVSGTSCVGGFEAILDHDCMAIGSGKDWRANFKHSKHDTLADALLTSGVIRHDIALYDALCKLIDDKTALGKVHAYGAAEGVCVLVDDSEFIAAVGADLQREYTELLSTLPADIPTVYNTDMSEVDALINSVSLPGDTQ